MSFAGRRLCRWLRRRRSALRRRAHGPDRSPAVLERRRGRSKSIIDFVAACHRRRAARTSSPPSSASPCSTTTARCGASSPSISSSCSRSIASRRWRRSIRNGRQRSRSRRVLDDDMKALAALGEKGLPQIVAATHAGMTKDEFYEVASGLDRDRAASALQPALHRSGLSADAGTAGVSARQRLQDLHRLRRRRRVHAALGREGLRHSAGAGGRLHRSWSSSRSARRQARADQDAKIEFIDDGPANRSASTASSAGVRSSPSATPTATADAGMDGGRRAARASSASSITPMPCANTPTTGTRRSASSTRRWTRRSRKGWTVVDIARVLGRSRRERSSVTRALVVVGRFWRVDIPVAAQVQIAFVSLPGRKEEADLRADADRGALVVAELRAEAAVAGDLLIDIAGQPEVNALADELRRRPVEIEVDAILVLQRRIGAAEAHAPATTENSCPVFGSR